MQDRRAQYLGLTMFPATLTVAEIDELFMLDDDIARMVGARRTPLTRLGLVLQIGFLRLTGRSLNSVQVIPPAVLTRADQAADISAPQLASIRSIYLRWMTLYQHQQAAIAALAFRDHGDANERALAGHLRRMATQSFDSAASAVHDVETGETLFEWLREPTIVTSQINIAEAVQRRDALRNLRADRLSLGALPITGMRHHASGMATQKVQTLALLREPRRAVEIGCWLRLHFLQSNDVVLEQVSGRIGNLWRKAHGTVEIRAFRELEVYRAGVNAIRRALGHPSLSDAAMRTTAVTAIAPLPVATIGTRRAQAIRAEMAAWPARLRALPIS